MEVSPFFHQCFIHFSEEIITLSFRVTEVIICIIVSSFGSLILIFDAFSKIDLLSIFEFIAKYQMLFCTYVFKELLEQPCNYH